MSKPSSPALRRAVIIGGSIAGMLAAAAVGDHFDAIDIIEAHEVPNGPEPRAGVPQAAHFHTLLSGGAEAIEELLPGSVAAMVESGANRVAVTTDMVMYAPEGWYRRWQNATHYQITASRDLTDWVIRQQLLRNTKVTIHQRTRVIELLGDKHRVTGVRLRSSSGDESEMSAQLVIDASGRSSRTPHWLEDLGITGLSEARIDSGLSYASRVYQAPVSTRGWPVVNLQADFRNGQPRAGGIIPIERDRWHVSLIGPPGAEPGRDADAFEPYAKELRHPIVADLLARAKPLTDVSLTRTTANRRYFYERLRGWPDGLIVVGDAVAAFNPVYGQGMSVAALSALAIRRAISVGGPGPGVTRKAQRAVSLPVGAAWSLSVGTDIHRPDIKGGRPNIADRLLQRYISRLSLTATGSHLAATALTDVLMLQAPPASLMAPKVLLAAFRGPERPQLDGPPLSLAERRVLSDSDLEPSN
ncbi:NAD(P)/FAD-dependent oxidoreductase [Streptomyces sp. CAI-85]|uniref:NAD(P)/FAD-dependent oxidoreductase n=1 Tax=Streptomyces sp. CAI-85 TaxID=1472662 RepID=UPI001587D791|nr:FAD-dependent monooxygenase [Streptomyces sp. CAI-85]NUV58819.1 FAD-dependent oxidoreductase [Streptomyces sp. CAI-85]